MTQISCRPFSGGALMSLANSQLGKGRHRPEAFMAKSFAIIWQLQDKYLEPANVTAQHKAAFVEVPRQPAPNRTSRLVPKS